MRNYRRSPQVQRFVHYTIADLKRRAAGRWVEILQAAGIPSVLLESRRGMPCPKCGGSDRFGIMKDLAQRGAVHCRHCHNANTTPKAGDGIATLQWWLGLSLPDAVRWLGNYLGGGVAVPRVREIVQTIPIKTKSIDCEGFRLSADDWKDNLSEEKLNLVTSLLFLPSEPLVRLGVGWSPWNHATSWPMRNGSGDVIGIRLRCPRTARKWAVRGSAAGLFYSSDLLNVERPKRLWIVEGPTDTAAMLSLGFDAVGVPSAGGGADLLIDLARRILPREIVIIADHDENKAGIRGAERLADALLIIAPVRIVTPPPGVKDSRAWVVSGASREAIESAADVASVRHIVLEGSIHG